MKIRSAAQSARIAAAVARFGKRAGKRKKFDAIPVTRIQSEGLIGPAIKVVDAQTRSLIDDAMRKRIQAMGDQDGTA